MEKGGRINKIAYVILFSLECFFQTLPVKAEEPSLPPHLIQSVSEEDIVEGMLALDLFHCPVLEEPDLEAAYENVRDSVVRIDMGRAYGSGVICWMTEEGRFPQGYYAGARMLGSSETCDVGFLLVEKEEIGLRAFSGLRSALADGIYGGLRVDEEIFCLGAGREEDEMIFEEAVLEETDKYIETFGSEMLYGRGFAREGMSGGGMFDGCGRLIGLLTGGTYQNEIAGVPVTQVLEAYWEVTGV